MRKTCSPFSHGFFLGALVGQPAWHVEALSEAERSFYKDIQFLGGGKQREDNKACSCDWLDNVSPALLTAFQELKHKHRGRRGLFEAEKPGEVRALRRDLLQRCGSDKELSKFKNCAPAEVVQHVLCMEHGLALQHRSRCRGPASRCVLPATHRSATRGRRMALRAGRMMLPRLALAEPCLRSVVWPLEPVRLRSRWAAVRRAQGDARRLSALRPPDAVASRAPILRGGRTWKTEALWRCIPLRHHCWRWVGAEVDAISMSCVACCSNVEGPLGKFECFDKQHTFHACCGAEPQKHVPTVLRLPHNISSMKVARATARLLVPPDPFLGRQVPLGSEWSPAFLQEVKKEIRTGCTRKDEDATLAPKAIDNRLTAWLRGRTDGQAIIPELDAYIALNAVVSKDEWHARQPSARDATADGVQLMYAHGAGCTSLHECAEYGLVGGERRGRSLKTVHVPCSQDTSQRHYALPIAVQFMLWTPAIPKDAVRHRGIALLLGQPPGNVGHAVNDVNFLATFCMNLRNGQYDSIFGKIPGPRQVWIVPTYFRIWQCGTGNWWSPHCNSFPERAKLDAMAPMSRLLHEAALLLAPRNITIKWFDAAGSFKNPIWFDAVVQQWRDASGDARVWNAWRGALHRKCELPVALRASERQRNRKLIVLQRKRYNRGWFDLQDWLAHLMHFSWRQNFAVELVTQGDLRPCQQIAVYRDAVMVVAIASAELHLASVFLPEKAVMVEIDLAEGSKPPFRVFDFMRGPGMQVDGPVQRRAQGAAS
eukprot:TRINITY_DN40745_c0_g1_i1.p1 TRINITY_DN40745_c0_g1~~TRINITY_DN40745_c0_g1_i1.p1  ORF type:complete len:767 (+),score=118.21 TRINITY_DN40745_c0_g1_i1:137-2437(+)